MNILWEREDDTFQNRAVRYRSRLRLLVAVQIRESTTEPLNSADTCAHSQKKSQALIILQNMLLGLFVSNTILLQNSEVEHRLWLLGILKQV